ncbi:MAG: hypothetical protein ACC742_12785 [Thermoanaerobaculales bacterium]
MNDDAKPSAATDLRPVVSRLKEIQRRCASMGSRNEEFPQMEERLGAIIARLEAGEGDSGEPVGYRAIAQELFPVAHLFESYGFTSVGKEIAHVERSLNELEPEPVTPATSTPQRTAVSGGAAAARDPSTPAELDDFELVRVEDAGETPQTTMPRPVAVGLVVLVIGCAIAAAIVFMRQPLQRALPSPKAPSAAVVITTQAPVVKPTAVQAAAVSTPNPGAQLAIEIGKARLALSSGDVDAAIQHLSSAALINVDDATVIGTAQRVVTALVAEADGAAGGGRWEYAERRLERAQRVAMRFGLSTTKIESAARRHASMDRFHILRPGDIAAIRAAAGRKAVVLMLNGVLREGHIRGVQGADLLLEVDSEIGRRGTMRYTDELPLAKIRELRVY